MTVRADVTDDLDVARLFDETARGVRRRRRRGPRADGRRRGPPRPRGATSCARAAPSSPIAPAAPIAAGARATPAGPRHRRRRHPRRARRRGRPGRSGDRGSGRVPRPVAGAAALAEIPEGRVAARWSSSVAPRWRLPVRRGSSDEPPSAPRSTVCSRRRATVRAASSSSAARRASARPRCCATPPGRRPASASRRSTGVRGRDGAAVRRDPSALRADARPGSTRFRAPQRDALSVALGLASGAVPDRFLVGLAVLGLLSAAAEERPLLCLVEDAQWLDAASSQILGFVARRLLAESVAIVVAVREPADAAADFDGLPELRLDGLRRRRARALLARRRRRAASTSASATGSSPRPAATRSRCSSCRGRMSAAELAGGFELPAAAADLPAHIEDHYVRRVDELPGGDPAAAAARGGGPAGRRDARVAGRPSSSASTTGALAPAEEAELLEIGSRVRFRHPLVRSAVYRAASADRPPARARGAGRGERSGGRRRSARVAPRPGGAGPRRGRRRRARTIGRPGAGSRRRGGRGRVPPARRRAHAGPGAARDRARWRRRRQRPGRGVRRRPRAARRGRGRRRSTSAQRARVDLLRAQLAFVSRRGTEATAAAARRRAPARAARRRGSRARRTSTRSPRRCSGRGSTARSGVPRGGRRRPRTRHARRTRSRSDRGPAARRAHRPLRRLRGGRTGLPVGASGGSRASRPRPRSASAGCGRAASSPSRCGTTSAPTCCRIAASTSPGRPARSASSRWRSARARPCSCSAASCRPPRRRSRRPSPSRRRPASAPRRTAR